MEYEKIKQLMDDMGNSKLTAIDIDFPDGTKISMKKEIVVSETSPKISSNSKNVIEEINELTEERKENNAPKQNDIEQKGNIVKSPMVGTFYIKPSPTDNPYVEVGSEVKKGDTLCIIEAMKLMNEIQSEYSGKITEIFIEDGSTVQYGTELFRIE